VTRHALPNRPRPNQRFRVRAQLTEAPLHARTAASVAQGLASSFSHSDLFSFRFRPVNRRGLFQCPPDLFPGWTTAEPTVSDVFPVDFVVRLQATRSKYALMRRGRDRSPHKYSALRTGVTGVASSASFGPSDWVAASARSSGSADRSSTKKPQRVTAVVPLTFLFATSISISILIS